VRISIIGSGYVGLVSGACFADFGHTVCCVDQDTAKVARLKRGEVPIYEPGLSELVSSNVEVGRLTFTTDLAEAVRAADVVFIAVGTPSRRGDGHADLSYVYAATREIGAALGSRYKLIVTKSTVPVGTGDEVERLLREMRPNGNFSVASNPEFLREGAAINDFKRPDRIVIGVEDDKARDVMTEVYRPLFLNQAPVVFMRRRAAELTKYAANAFLAAKITFINEVADLCESIGADVQEIARGIGLDNRIGPKFLHAGPGFGGSCFPKDTLALIKTAQDYDKPMRMIETVVAINDRRKRSMAKKVIAACGGSVRDKRVAVLGLTFKPNTDDTREAPALAIIQALLDAGAVVTAYDPKGMEHCRDLLPEVELASDLYACAEGAHALVIATEWDAFRALDFTRLKEIMAAPALVDLRNIYRPDFVRAEGFVYESVGRGEHSETAAAVSTAA
jgi:UDPglucose 6-dehydrogenase